MGPIACHWDRLPSYFTIPVTGIVKYDESTIFKGIYEAHAKTRCRCRGAPPKPKYGIRVL